ncbi:MAG: serine/threonine-protein phosphatase [Ktedonobacterales bacterium]|nr:serine/threonine-protein phosphatase [Ktedonobacterales bacterium]
MPLHITAVSQTDPGTVRDRNEDNHYVRVADPPHDDMALLVVADGMGGYKAGDEASRIAIATVRAELEPLLAPSTAQPTMRLGTQAEGDGERTTVFLPETAATEHYHGYLGAAVRKANETIVAYGQDHRESRGLGSTITMVITARGRAYFANVGDSRSYLFRAGELRAITRDHSLVARLVEAGQLDPDDVYTHPKRNLIYRSLGTDREDLEVDLFEEALQPGDMLLLCSDGLWEKVRSPETVQILQNTADLREACARLIALANANGGEDNITLVLARVDGTLDLTPTVVLAADIADIDTGEMAAQG